MEEHSRETQENWRHQRAHNETSKIYLQYDCQLTCTLLGAVGHKMKSLTALILTTAFALGALASDEPRWSVDGRINLQERLTEREDGWKDSAKGSYQVDGGFFLNQCTELRGRITSGSTYNSNTDNLGIGEGDSDINFNVRHLYLDTNCLNKNVTVQAGAMNVVNGGSLGLSTSGWVDGVRVIINEESSGRSWFLTIGNIDELDDPNLFQRKFMDEVNYKAAELSQDFGSEDQHTVLLSVADFKDTSFLRAGIRLAVSDYIKMGQSSCGGGYLCRW